MTAANLDTLSTVLAVGFGLVLLGLVGWVAKRTDGRPKMLALYALACALIGRLVGLALTMVFHGYTAVGISFAIQTVLTLASYALLVGAVVSALRGEVYDDEDELEDSELTGTPGGPPRPASGPRGEIPIPALSTAQRPAAGATRR